MERPNSYVYDLGNKKPFNVIDEFDSWRKQSDLVEATTAIWVMAVAIRGSEATTMMELEIALNRLLIH